MTQLKIVGTSYHLLRYRCQVLSGSTPPHHETSQNYFLPWSDWLAASIHGTHSYIYIYILPSLIVPYARIRVFPPKESGTVSGQSAAPAVGDREDTYIYTTNQLHMHTCVYCGDTVQCANPHNRVSCRG